MKVTFEDKKTKGVKQGQVRSNSIGDVVLIGSKSVVDIRCMHPVTNMMNGYAFNATVGYIEREFPNIHEDVEILIKD